MKLLFFFQAEDGIRDATVTGVQTCALPIFAVLTACGAGIRATRGRGGGARAVRAAARGSAGLGASLAATNAARGNTAARSEERRVGKECSCRRSRLHEQQHDERQHKTPADE